jgi:hypothetical protein
LGGLQGHSHSHGHGVEGSASLEGVVPGAVAGAGAGIGAGEADASLRAARETIALKLQVSRLREEAAVKQRELGALQHEHAAFRSEYERTRTRLLAVQGDLEARAKELAAVRTEAASAQAKARETTQSLTAENAQLRADLKQVKAQLETLLGFSEAKEAECARLRGENAKQAAEVKDLTGKVGSLLGYSGLKDRELREVSRLASCPSCVRIRPDPCEHACAAACRDGPTAGRVGAGAEAGDAAGLQRGPDRGLPRRARQAVAAARAWVVVSSLQLHVGARKLRNCTIRIRFEQDLADNTDCWPGAVRCAALRVQMNLLWIFLWTQQRKSM